jgi:hypothetical protein
MKLHACSPIAILSMALLLGAALSCAAEEDLEYKVKAAYLANFAQFVDWPEKSFENKDSPIVIAVLETDPFGANLERAVANKTANGRAIKIKRVRNADDAAGCHILYVGTYDRDKLSKCFKAIKSKPILTVGESADFMREGGIIRFVIRDERVQLDINAEGATELGLRISSKLLRLANLVKVREK